MPFFLGRTPAGFPSPAQADGSANAPGAVWSPRIQQFLDDPVSKAGLARGMEVQRLEALAAGKAFDPTELAITHMDEAGNPVVAAVPNMRTLDAVKRGLDEILNDYPRQHGGQLILDQRGRAVDQVRRSFLGHLDTLNDDYAAARSAYAGPMASRGALDRGQAFYNMTPDTVGVAVQGQTPATPHRATSFPTQRFRCASCIPSTIQKRFRGILRPVRC